MRLRVPTTALLASALMTLSACSLGTGGDDADDDRESGAATSAGAPADPEVVLMTHGSFALPEKLLTSFERETGYRLEVRKSGDAGQLASKLTLSAGNPEGDVVFGIDNTFASRVLDAGALAAYTPEELPAGVEENALAGDDGEHLTAVDTGNVCVNVDTTWFEQRDVAPPETLQDLTEPAYRDLLAVPGATTSSPGLAFLLATVAEFGDGWPEYWADLMGNGAKVVDGWDQAYYVEFTQGGGEGTRPIVVSYDSSPAFTIGEDGETTTAALLDTCIRQVEYAGVLEGADNPEGAQAVVDFLISPEVQAALPDSMYVYPAVEGTPLPDAWAEHTRRPETVNEVDPADIEAHREEWLQQWSDVVSR